MKRIYTVLAIVAFATAAIPSYANSWQWQLDQIKAAHHVSNCQAREQARLAKEKTIVGQQADASHVIKAVSAQPAK